MQHHAPVAQGGPAGPPVGQGIDGGGGEGPGHRPVAGGGNAAALGVAQPAEAQPGVDPVGKVVQQRFQPRHPFRGDNQGVAAGGDAGPRLDGYLGQVGRPLRHQDGIGTGQLCQRLGNEAGVAAQRLQREKPGHRLRSVADAIDHHHPGVQCRVVAQRVVAAGHVVVDGRRNAGHGQTGLGQQRRTGQRTAAADHHNAVDADPADRGYQFGHPVGEVRQPGGAQPGTAITGEPQGFGFVDRRRLAGHQTDIPVADADHLPAPPPGRHGDSPDGGVHARRIAAGGQHGQTGHADPIISFTSSLSSVSDALRSPALRPRSSTRMRSETAKMSFRLWEM